MPYLSVIIPAYNEERRLPATLESVHAFLQTWGKSFEIIVVDDGSTDATSEIVQSFAMHHEGIRLLSYSPNQGKGHAVRTGILAGSGDLMLIDDADGSSPIEELVRLEAAMRDGWEIAIGSRAKPDPERTVKALVHRKYIGNTFNIIVQSLLLPGIYDTQCGFKMFRNDVAQDLFSVCRQNGYAFDVEVLYVAKRRGYRISEIAINWSNVEGSKVNVLVDSPKMLIDVIRITCGAWFGVYKQISDRKQKPSKSPTE